MSAFSLAANHRPYLLVGATPEVRATVDVRATGIGGGGVDASLRLWTPHGATIAVFSEWAPAIRDLRRRAVRLDDRTVACPAERWSDGEREYELTIVLPPGAAGDEILVARLAVIVDDEVVARAPIAVTWTDDETLFGSPRPDDDDTVASSLLADLPTGRSPAPRHALGLAAPDVALRCPACDLRGAPGDRFCEDCGNALGDPRRRGARGPQKS